MCDFIIRLKNYVYYYFVKAIIEGVKRVNFALISDVLFFALCSFLISFTAIRYYTKKAALALILAILTALAVGVLCFLALYSKRSKRLAAMLGENEKKSLSLHLSVCSGAYVKNLFLKALDGAYEEDNRIYDDERACFFNFKMSPVSSDDVAEIIKCETPKNKCLYCCAIAPDALSLAKDFSIDVKTVGDIYVLLKDKNLLPKKYALGEVKKPKFFARLKSRFSRKLCPPLFFGGLTLMFFSFFTYYPVYYIVSGAILTVLSAVSLLFGQSS